MTGLLPLALVLAAVLALAWWLRRREGRLVAVRDGVFAPDALARLGVPRGAVALVEFTAPDCRSCVAAQAVLEEVAAAHGGVAVARVDVGLDLDLARRHGVLRAPTTLVVDPAGAVRHRVHGVPDVGQLRAALG